MNKHFKTINKQIQKHYKHNIQFSYELYDDFVMCLPKGVNKNLGEDYGVVYTLIGTTIKYHHLEIDIPIKYQILIGDYLFSYATQLLYNNKQFNSLSIFSKLSKQLILNYSYKNLLLLKTKIYDIIKSGDN